MSGAIEVVRCARWDVRELQEAWLRGMSAQVVHWSWHARGFLDLFAVRAGGDTVGYGAVGAVSPEPHDIVKEFHLAPSARTHAPAMFRRLVAESGARWIEAQTNDALLCDLLRAHATDVSEQHLLFEDGWTTSLTCDGARLEPLSPETRARVFAHEVEPVGDWGVVVAEEVVATGGLLTHYNRPYADLFMEVAAPYRRRGYGSWLVQELKRVAVAAGHVPAARCRPRNVASARTLERAGMVKRAAILRGRLVP
jgi:GNAT superfamily N-acetyltransferase